VHLAFYFLCLRCKAQTIVFVFRQSPELFAAHRFAWQGHLISSQLFVFYDVFVFVVVTTMYVKKNSGFEYQRNFEKVLELLTTM
jgi:hypothetical protein